ELGEKERENRHLERDSEREQQLRRERQVLADSDRRRNVDARVLAQEKRVADLEHHRPAEVAARDEKKRGGNYEWTRHPAFALQQSRRDELPDFVEDRRTRDEEPGDERHLDLGEERLAHAGADEQHLAVRNLADGPGKRGENLVVD